MRSAPGWNSAALLSDSDGMDCEQCREEVSALLDDEQAAPREVVADHLARCAACRGFAATAERMDRLVRVRPAEPVPDLTAAVLAAAGLVEPGTGPVAPAGAERPGLVSVGGCCGPASCVPVGDEQAAAGTGTCGCAANCGCGCQQGAPCRCGQRAA